MQSLPHLHQHTGIYFVNVLRNFIGIYFAKSCRIVYFVKPAEFFFFVEKCILSSPAEFFFFVE